MKWRHQKWFQTVQIHMKIQFKFFDTQKDTTLRQTREETARFEPTIKKKKKLLRAGASMS